MRNVGECAGGGEGRQCSSVSVLLIINGTIMKGVRMCVYGRGRGGRVRSVREYKTRSSRRGDPTIQVIPDRIAHQPFVCRPACPKFLPKSPMSSKSPISTVPYLSCRCRSAIRLFPPPHTQNRREWERDVAFDVINNPTIIYNYKVIGHIKQV